MESVESGNGDFFQELAQQVAQADLTMHAWQKEAWLQLYRNPPRGERIPDDLLKGFAENRYLAVDEICMELHFKKKSTMGFWNRLKLGFRFIFTKPNLFTPFVVEVCSPRSRDAQHMKVRVKRQGPGKMSVQTQPISRETDG
ncbi:MAG: hypothetical protein MI784_15900 [Cytophagales bacterium]|nr:hypothetical protein [Cytophagales bacterium]